MRRTKMILKSVWNWTPFFPTWAKVEKQRPGSKPNWDEFGPFKMKRNRMILKGLGT